MKQTLSVVFSVHNEEKLFEEALKSIKGIADEIIIVDNESTDKTAQISKKYTKSVYEHKNTPNSLNTSKNYGFSKAKGDWILSLDADERVSPDLAKEIRSVISTAGSLRNLSLPIDVSQTSINGYWTPRKNKIFGKWLTGGIWWPDYQLRLFKNGCGKFPAEHNHEFLTVDGNTAYLNNPLEHYSYTSIVQYVEKFTYTYLENEVDNQIAAGKKVYWFDAIRMPSSDFVINFFVRQGYKDGLHGLILAMLQMFYMFLVFARIWERQGSPVYESERFTDEVTGELKRSRNEYLHWYWLSKNTFLLRAARKIKREIRTFLNNKLKKNLQMP
jgi:glycosyltransferase involved in cell wall biosynthesis